MTTPKCVHGYFTHSPYNRCPWCFGWDASNRNAVPVKGSGNGWLLKQGDPVCQGCGGPADAGHGILPAEMTHEQWKQHRQTIKNCYYCSSVGWFLKR